MSNRPACPRCERMVAELRRLQDVVSEVDRASIDPIVDDYDTHRRQMALLDAFDLLIDETDGNWCESQARRAEGYARKRDYAGAERWLKKTQAEQRVRGGRPFPRIDSLLAMLRPATETS